MTVPAGGPATINGIIYQMLWSLCHTTNMYVSRELDPSGEFPIMMSLVLEPVGGGGDVVYRDSVERVQQLKADSSGGTWSLRNIVLDVLPDLYRGVKLGEPQLFELVTEGQMGQWKEAFTFFTELKNRPPAIADGDPRERLNPSKIIRFSGSIESGSDDTKAPTSSQKSETELFEAIVSVIREKKPGKDESETTTRRNVWHLLSNLAFTWGETKAKLDDKLRRQLIAFVEEGEDVEITLNALLMALQKEATQGSAKIDALKFFRKHGIHAQPLTSWSGVLRSSVEGLPSAMDPLHYHAEADVRTLPTLPDLEEFNPQHTRFLVLTGQSGQGKTWRLCSLARTLAHEKPVVVLPATGDGDKDIALAAEMFWLRICHHERVLTMRGISQRILVAVPERSGNWLTICIDGIQQFDEAKAIYNGLAGIEGISVVMTLPEDAAKSFDKLAAGWAKVAVIQNFTEKELRRYICNDDLERWHEIREDIRQIIQRPLLAKLYRDLTYQGRWADPTEYDLFAMYFQRFLHEPVRSNFRFGMLWLKKAMLATWEGQPYPWTIEQIVAFGFSEALVDFLVQNGWLVCDTLDRYQVWHDRILNWHVAEVLSMGLQIGSLDPVVVGQRCATALRDHNDDHLAKLGYVPMDLIWLLVRRAGTAFDILDSIIVELDRGFMTQGALYEGLLPTIGSGIAPALFRRLETVANSENIQYYDPIVNGLTSLDVAAVAPHAITLLQSSNWILRHAAYRILSQRPHGDALEILWDRYSSLCCDHNLGYDHPGDRSVNNRSELREILPALQGCVIQSPEWLEATIRSARRDEHPIGVFANLLQDVPGGREWWLQLKNVLRNKITPEDEWYYADAIYHFNDMEEVSWLREKIHAQQPLAQYAWTALVRVSPDAALSALDHILPVQARDLGLQRLLLARRKEVYSQVSKLIDNNPEGIWDYMAALGRGDGTIDETILRKIFQALSDRLGNSATPPPWRQIQIVANVTDLEGLKQLSEWAGTDLEEYLVKIIAEHAGRQDSGYLDPHVLSVVTLLYKIKGKGLTTVVNRWLTSSNYYVRSTALDWAFKRPDHITIGLIEAMILDNPLGNAAHPDPQSALAQRALARAGAWQSVVRTILHLQEMSDREVLYARIGCGPLSDEDMQPALSALDTSPKNTGAIFALGFGQRNDKIPHIVAILNAEPPDIYTDVANACIWALDAMAKITQEAEDALIARLRQDHDSQHVADILQRSGSAQSNLAVLEHFRVALSRKFPEGIPYDHIASLNLHARYLLKQPDTGPQASVMCRERIAQADLNTDIIAQEIVLGLSRWDSDDEAFSEVLDSEPVQAFLKKRAFAKDGSFHVGGRKISSVLGVAPFGKQEAYLAALRTLRNPKGNDRESMPYLLVSLDPDRGVTDLTFQLQNERSSSMRDTCARALVNRANATELLLGDLRSVDAAKRRVACFALRFAEPSNELITTLHGLIEDDDTLVYETALESTNHVSSELNARKLATAYRQADDTSRRWILLDAALETGDLGDDTEPALPWLREMCSNLSPIHAYYVNDRIEELRKKAAEEHQRRDQRNEGR